MLQFVLTVNCFYGSFAAMKKWVICVVFVFSGFLLFAQKSVVVTPVIDSIKAKWGKTKIVDGTPMKSSNDFIENMASSKDYTILIRAIENAGLTQTFKSKGPIT